MKCLGGSEIKLAMLLTTRSFVVVLHTGAEKEV